MKKVGVILLFCLLAVSVVIAQSNESQTDDSDVPTDTVELAYQCLEDLIEEKDEDAISLQEAIFSTLALGSDNKLESVIEDSTNTDDCWPDSSCAIKETAQVLLAYERINKNTDDIQTWLIEKNETATELTWYMQIDIANQEESECTIGYGSTEKTITVNEDMTLSSGAGSCLTKSSSGFWLKVSDSCIDKTFRVSCDQDFVTSLLYQRDGFSTIFVSPTAHAASALGTTEESINSKCFKLGGSCDYEGSLWAAYALDQTGYDISAFLPYLLALSQENKRFSPHTFLYALTQGTDQYSEIVQAQQQGDYWQAPNTPYNRFYDTSLAFLALSSSGAQEVANAQNYLLSIQTPEGCWNNNNIRDTAFVLYAGWSQSVPGSGGGSSGAPESCILSGYQCTSSLFSCNDAGGVALDLDCDLGVCCSVPVVPTSCSQQNGIVCGASETCSGTVTNSLDGSCCLGVCEKVQETTQCQNNGGSCFSSCTSNEVQTADSCNDPGLVCCVAQSTPSDSSGSNVWWWVFILLILIVIIVLLIVFRRRLQVAFFKLKNRRKKSGGKGVPPGKHPPHPPYGRRPVPPQMRRPVGQRMVPSGAVSQRTPARKSQQSQTDKELDETLKKLKEMSK